MAELDELVFDFNKLILHPEFEDTINEVSKLGLSMPEIESNAGYFLAEREFLNGELVVPVGDIKAERLDASNGETTFNKTSISAYDESIDKFHSLEGVAFFTSHSLVFVDKESYLPANYLTLYFYTKSEEIVKRSQHIRLSTEPELDSKKDYIRDRIHFLGRAAPKGCVLFIDGPLIGGDVYTIMMRSITRFHEDNILPIFFVKNSASNLVTDNIKELRAKYNSDLHWAYKYLKPGERTSFFIYRDRVNPENAKAFCYLKAFDLSPQRVEMHINSYSRCEKIASSLMDMVYYLLLVQGDRYNPQVRPIAIAEMYARHTLKLINMSKFMYEIGIVPTMNQTRFGR